MAFAHTVTAIFMPEQQPVSTGEIHAGNDALATG
jgi:hypothetical protein